MLTGGSVRSWRDQVYAAPMSPAVRWFALTVLSPRCRADGLVVTGGAGRLIDDWCQLGPRRSCSARLAGRMIAALIRAGLLERADPPAPGRPASYRIRLLHVVQLVTPRPRGAAPARLHAMFMKEQKDYHGTGPP
jgi:hypothetical protein